MRVLQSVTLLAGMPRAGTAWLYELLNALVVLAGGEDARDIRRRYRLEKVLSAGNAVFAPKLPATAQVLWPYFRGHRYVLKTHISAEAYPRRVVSRRFFHLAVRQGWFLPLYIYRDPRDCILSAYEYGQRREPGVASGRFARMVPDIETGIAWMQRYIQINWRAWTQNYPGILILRYEDLLADYAAQTGRILRYLGIPPTYPGLAATLARFRPGQAAGTSAGMHLHKAQVGRFRAVFTAEQKQACLQAFGQELKEMGYAWE